MLPIQIISAPSILGLKPTGVEKLPESLLSHGLSENLHVQVPVIKVPVLNMNYDFARDTTNCLNPLAIREFSIELGNHLRDALDQGYFPLILGGDCSIVIGVLAALKLRGIYGLIFCDAHADFYEPGKSISGEVADMDLAIITGRGPDVLTNIYDAIPYVCDSHVIHIGQRDWEETRKFGSEDIKETSMLCFDFDTIQRKSIQSILEKAVQAVTDMKVDGLWLHFDTDVLSDQENPAVDYRLPGGLSSEEFEILLKGLMATNKITGMTVTIFNPNLDDEQESVSRKLTELISRSFNKDGATARNNSRQPDV